MSDTKKTCSPLEAVGDNIVSKTANWAFNGDVAKTFGEHVRRSVPLYDMGHDLVCRLSDFFVNDQSTCYELGCSTGELLRKLAEHNAHKPGCQWIGIDNSPSMVVEAKSRCAATENIDVVQDDINLVSLKRSDFIVAYYTIQFNRPHLRQPLFDRIFESLNWGGALVLFEKVRGPDARFQDMLNALYDDFKREQGFDDHEIMSKSRSLRGILEPYSSQANIDFLSRAGFRDVMPIMKYLNFEGLLAIK